ncbi:MAG: hypothetical protein HZA52_11800 [Planctomycetes bacterium]|nr:hypothetical protein [Planctomycetota bacterium]
MANVSRVPFTIHSTLQGAIDAAQEGDVLLAHGGSYSGFTIDHRSIAIFAMPGEPVAVSGTVNVSHLSTDQQVVLSGLAITGPTSSTSAGGSGILLSASTGALWVQGCDVRGGAATGKTGKPGGDGLWASSACSVVVVDTTAIGGKGADESHELFDPWPGDGGAGCRASNGARIALYGGSYEGGKGGYDSWGYGGGYAGIGVWTSDTLLFAAAATMRGGDGGDSVLYPEAGGAGLGVGQLVSATWLSCAAFGGHGGVGPGVTGPDGPPVVGTVTSLAAQARHAGLPSIAAAGAVIPVTLDGLAGDRMWLASSVTSGWRLQLPNNGVWTTTYPAKLPLAPLAVLPSSGTATAYWRTPTAGASGVSKAFVQGRCLPDQGGAVLGNPQCVLLIDPTGQPDCDGNGVFDLLDVIHGAPDANGNLVPDACDAQSIYYVDDDAPPGGDGSFASPFLALRDGVDAAFPGDQVVVLDGLYLGPDNRDVDFGGKTLIVRSQNGPANCVIDCQHAGRAFRVHSQEAVGTRIDGLTIRNGIATTPSSGGAIVVESASNADVTRCVFEANWAQSGGAIAIVGRADAAVHVADCAFSANAAAISGGAIASARSLLVTNCRFDGNSAMAGGALSVDATISGPMTVDLGHCEFRNNVAGDAGGAIHVSQSNGLAAVSIRATNVLCVGNVAGTQGGAIRTVSTSAVQALQIAHSTFSANSTTLSGASNGGGALATSNTNTTLLDSIFWGDTTAGVGAEMRASGGMTSLAYCDVQGGIAGIHVVAGGLNWGAGNLSLHPRFIDPDGPDNDPLTFGDNVYRLRPNSPCLDAGDAVNALADFTDIDGDLDFGELVPLDLNLKPRFTDLPSIPDTGVGYPPIDLGCYERQN